MRPCILDRVESEGHAVFESGDFNVNIVGVRTSDSRANSFNDYLHLIYKDDGEWVEKIYSITTDPGVYWLDNPGRIEGTAILVPGQYRSVYRIDKHSGKYDALCQRGGKVKVWRDANRDNVLDWHTGEEYEGYYGINIHRSTARGTSAQVNKWSAGCQVFANSDDFKEFMSICKKAKSVWGNSFTYTLLENQF